MSRDKAMQLDLEFNGNTDNTVNEIIHEFDDIFADESKPLTVNNFYEQELFLTDKAPVYVRPYRVPYALREELDRQIQDLLLQGII